MIELEIPLGIQRMGLFNGSWKPVRALGAALAWRTLLAVAVRNDHMSRTEVPHGLRALEIPMSIRLPYPTNTSLPTGGSHRYLRFLWVSDRSARPRQIGCS